MSEFRRKTENSRNSIKSREVKEEKFRQVGLKSSEMQLIVKRANEKRQSIIKDIIKKLDLPQVSPRLLNSLCMLVDSYPMNEEMYSEHLVQLPKGRIKRLTHIKVEGLSSIKRHEGKMKEFRKIKKEKYQNKAKFNRLRDGEVSARGKKECEQLENFWFLVDEREWMMLFLKIDHR